MNRPRQFELDEVLERAIEVFWAKGYRNATPRELAECTGLSKSSLYNTFGSKRGLFERALDRYIERQQSEVSALLHAHELSTGLSKMYEQIILVSMPQESGGMGMSCMMASASMEVDPTDKPLIELVRRGRQAVIAVFRARLERARVEGELSKDRDTLGMARLLYNTYIGLVVLARSGTDRKALQDIAAKTIEAVTR